MAQAVARGDEDARAIVAALAPLGRGVALDSTIGLLSSCPVSSLRRFAEMARDAGLAPSQVFGWVSNEDSSWRQLVFAYKTDDPGALRERFAALLGDAERSGIPADVLDRIGFEA